MNYYEILGIDFNASKNEIKQAYRKLSLQLHPDKNNNNQENKSKITFEELNEAYNILFNDNSRITYDNTIGKNNIVSIKNNETKKEENVSTLIYSMTITLEDSYFGGSFPLSIERIIYNNEIKEKEKETIYVDLSQGIDNEEIIILKEKGNMNKSGIYGDLKIQIFIQEHAIFKRKGLNLLLDKNISFKDSICGFDIAINHINNNKFILKNYGEIILNKSNKIIKKKGFIRNNNIGNLIINFFVEIPDKLSKDQIAKLNTIL